jgi:rhodanese-related sulfurtransferase
MSRSSRSTSRRSTRGCRRRCGGARRDLPRVLLAALALLASGVVGCRVGLQRALRVTEIEAGALDRELRGATPPLLIDVRRPDEYEASHLAGSLLVSVDAMAGFFTRSPLRPPLDRPVVLICHSGMRSLVGAAVVSGHGYTNVRSLSGGVARWTALGLPVERGAARAPLDPQTLRPPTIGASLLVQIVAVASAFIIKPTYMLLSLMVIIALWRRPERDLALIRNSMVAFLAGEGICAVNYIIGETDSGDLLHGLGMLVMGALLPWGLFRLLDERVLRLSDPESRCVVQRFCGHCWKKDPVSCGVQRLFLFLAPALALLALLPLCAPLQRLDVVYQVFGNEVRSFKGLEAQFVEFRIYPLIAALLLLITTGLLARGDRAALQRAQAPFFAGFGFMSYSLMRFVFFTCFRRDQPTWIDFWEEATEFMTVGVVCLVLWVFRRQLALGRAGRTPEPPTEEAS